MDCSREWATVLLNQPSLDASIVALKKKSQGSNRLNLLFRFRCWTGIPRRLATGIHDWWRVPHTYSSSSGASASGLADAACATSEAPWCTPRPGSRARMPLPPVSTQWENHTAECRSMGTPAAHQSTSTGPRIHGNKMTNLIQKMWVTQNVEVCELSLLTNQTPY